MFKTGKDLEKKIKKIPGYSQKSAITGDSEKLL